MDEYPSHRCTLATATALAMICLANECRNRASDLAPRGSLPAGRRSTGLVELVDLNRKRFRTMTGAWLQSATAHRFAFCRVMPACERAGDDPQTGRQSGLSLSGPMIWTTAGSTSNSPPGSSVRARAVAGAHVHVPSAAARRRRACGCGHRRARTSRRSRARPRSPTRRRGLEKLVRKNLPMLVEATREVLPSPHQDGATGPSRPCRRGSRRGLGHARASGATRRRCRHRCDRRIRVRTGGSVREERGGPTDEETEANSSARRHQPAEPLPPGLERVVLIRELREVRAQVGFTRLARSNRSHATQR